MNSQLVISFKDILLFVLWGCLVTIFVYLILILRRALNLVKQVNQVVDSNRQNIDSTMNVVPELTKHIETITGEVAHDVQSFRGTIDNVASTTESITDTIKENQNFMDGLSSLMHTLSMGKALYDKYFGNKIDDLKSTVADVKRAVDEHQE